MCLNNTGILRKNILPQYGLLFKRFHISNRYSTVCLKSYYSYSLTYGQFQAATGSVASHEFHVPHPRRLITRSIMIPASVIAKQTTTSVFKTNLSRSSLIPTLTFSLKQSQRILLCCLPFLSGKAVNVPVTGYDPNGFLSKNKEGIFSSFTLYLASGFDSSPLF